MFYKMKNGSKLAECYCIQSKFTALFAKVQNVKKGAKKDKLKATFYECRL